MEYAISSESMKLSDNLTIKNGVSAIELMGRASHALFCEVTKLDLKKIAIVCGSGNNGGDGYCLALQLLDNGVYVQVFGKQPKTDSAKYYYNTLQEKYPNSFACIENINELSKYDVVVDCLLGIGIKGELSNEYIQYIKKINKAKYVVSCDIPSGLNSDNGIAMPIAVKANQTIAIQSYKTGHFLSDGKDYTGKLSKCDIGIEVVGEKYYIADCDFVKEYFPKRMNNSHKGSYGRCGIIACSQNFVGSGLLAMMSSTAMSGECAMRTGCGYSYLFVPDNMLPYLWGRVTHSCIYGHSDIKNHKLDAIAFGMGIGDNYNLSKTVFNYPCIKVVDADGLNILAKNPEFLPSLNNCVVTPHPMEFSRLTGINVKDILKNPIEYAKEYAIKNKLVVLLKGSTTIITDGEETYLNIAGNSGLAKGGSGDVLAGIIASLIAQGASSLKSSVMASFIAGKTCEIIAENSCEASMLPQDVAMCVGNTVCNILKSKI